MPSTTNKHSKNTSCTTIANYYYYYHYDIIRSEFESYMWGHNYNFIEGIQFFHMEKRGRTFMDSPWILPKLDLFPKSVDPQLFHWESVSELTVPIQINHSTSNWAPNLWNTQIKCNTVSQMVFLYPRSLFFSVLFMRLTH